MIRLEVYVMGMMMSNVEKSATKNQSDFDGSCCWLLMCFIEQQQQPKNVRVPVRNDAVVSEPNCQQLARTIGLPVLPRRKVKMMMHQIYTNVNR